MTDFYTHEEVKNILLYDKRGRYSIGIQKLSNRISDHLCAATIGHITEYITEVFPGGDSK